MEKFHHFDQIHKTENERVDVKGLYAAEGEIPALADDHKFTILPCLTPSFQFKFYAY